MEINEAIARIERAKLADNRGLKLVIPVVSQGSLGGQPCVEVKDIVAGFDWDAGKLIISPASPLTTLTPEQVEDIRKSVADGQSWHAYQSYKASQEKLKTIEARRDELLASLKSMCAAFRALDLPYGSTEYTQANALINRIERGGA